MGSTIGVSTWSLQHATLTQGMDIDKMIETVASMGVDGIDFLHEYIPCYPGVNLAELNRIAKVCKSYNLPIKSTWFMADLASGCVATSHERMLEELKKYIAVTAAFGCDFMSVPMLFYVPGFKEEQYYDCLMRLLEKALPIAEEYNVRIAHELGRVGGAELGLRLIKDLDHKYYALCPDLESWRLETEDIPLAHAEMGPDEECVPASLELFRECLPYSPSLHFKILALDEAGEEPHFPIQGLMDAINESPIVHHLAIEYEGWIPGIHPERDCIEETRRCVDLIRRYQK